MEIIGSQFATPVILNRLYYMRRSLWLWLLLIPAFLFAQEDQKVQRLVGDFGVGQNLNLGETSVSFLGVVSDSRCPKQVICIWAGEAKVLLGIKSGGNYFEKEVVVSGGGTEIPLANELLMEFSHLRPYPETGAKIPQEEYCLRISALFPVED